jgi:hypothetical protein
MSTIQSNPTTAYGPTPDMAIKDSLQVLDDALENTAAYSRGATFFELVDKELRRLHAHIRAHHASVCLQSPISGKDLPDEVHNEWTRLRDEHPRILGQLDWLIRHIELVADHPLENHDPFVLRLRELIAVLRRHDAEEERVYTIALWHDTGGES